MTRDRSIPFDPLQLVDTIVRWSLYVLLAFMPLAFGAVDGWSETIVTLLCSVIAVGLALRWGMKRDDSLRTWAMIPVALFLTLVLMQLLPLPTALISAISPQTAQTKRELLSDIPSARDFLQHMTLTFYAHATRHSLRIILCACAVFAAVLTYFRHSRDIRQLLGVIAAIGAGIAVLALLQDVTHAKQIYWLVPRDNFIARSGTFINRNNFAQFMNLSLGTALGLMLALQAEGRHDIEWALTPRQSSSRTVLGIRLLAAAIVIMAASIFLSQSRGGMVSLIAGGAVTGLLMSASRRVPGRGWILVPLGLGLLVFLMVVGLDTIAGRLATLREAQAAAGARVQIIRDVWTQLIPRFPLLGVGLGTHEFVYPMVSRQTFANLAGHVENEYVQVLEEMGSVGLLVVLGFVAIVVAGWIRSIRQLKKPIQSAAFGLGFGLIAVLVHSNSDFGQRLPAVACLTAVTCALLINLARPARSSPSPGNPGEGWGEGSSEGSVETLTPTLSRRTGRGGKAVAALTVLCVVATFAWVSIGATRWALAENQWSRATQLERFLARENWIGNNDDYIELLTRAKAATEWQPENVEYEHWLNVYRWYTVVRPDQQTGFVLIDDQARDWAKQIVDRFHAARALCPTFGPLSCMAGQIELFILHNARGEAHIRQGYALAPYSPEACFVAAALDVKRGQCDESMPKAHQALRLGQSADSLLALYLKDSDRADLAQQLVEGDMFAMMRLADRLDKDPRHAAEASTARQHAMQLVKERAARADAPADVVGLMAQAAMADKDFTAAATWYSRAIGLDYANVDWHLARAQCLAAVGSNDEAMREAQVCLRLRPYMPAAKALAEELSVRSPSKP